MCGCDTDDLKLYFSKSAIFHCDNLKTVPKFKLVCYGKMMVCCTQSSYSNAKSMPGLQLTLVTGLPGRPAYG